LRDLRNIFKSHAVVDIIPVSKGTSAAQKCGFSIAKSAAKLAGGYLLDEIKNDPAGAGRKTPAASS
jgi:carbamoylphosphate synthase large subunit